MKLVLKKCSIGYILNICFLVLMLVLFFTIPPSSTFQFFIFLGFFWAPSLVLLIAQTSSIVLFPTNAHKPKLGLIIPRTVLLIFGFFTINLFTINLSIYDMIIRICFGIGLVACIILSILDILLAVFDKKEHLKSKKENV